MTHYKIYGQEWVLNDVWRGLTLSGLVACSPLEHADNWLLTARGEHCTFMMRVVIPEEIQELIDEALMLPQDIPPETFKYDVVVKEY